MAQAPRRASATGWGGDWVVCLLSKRRKLSEQDTAESRKSSAIPIPRHLQAKEVPGVKVFRSSATMYFANAELYSDSLKEKVRLGSPCFVSVWEGLISLPAQSTSLHL